VQPSSKSSAVGESSAIAFIAYEVRWGVDRRAGYARESCTYLPYFDERDGHLRTSYVRADRLTCGKHSAANGGAAAAGSWYPRVPPAHPRVTSGALLGTGDELNKPSR
jgi:hypothetical protein